MTPCCYAILLAVACSIFSLSTVVCERDNILYCGACIALVEELSWQTGTTDPKKKIQIGSFQLDSRGNMKPHEVPLATSEVHLTEVMEVICRYMHYYTKSADLNGNTNYIRIAARDGSVISKKNTEDIKDIKHTLQFACEYVLEHYDDQLMKMYHEKEDEIAEKLCVDMAGLCTKQNVSEQMWAYASAVMLGLSEAAASRGDPAAKAHLNKDSPEEDADEGDDDDSDIDADSEDDEEQSDDDDDDDEENAEITIETSQIVSDKTDQNREEL